MQIHKISTAHFMNAREMPDEPECDLQTCSTQSAQRTNRMTKITNEASYSKVGCQMSRVYTQYTVLYTLALRHFQSI